MAKKRSKRRKKTGRSSLAPSKRPSAAPESTPPASDAKPSKQQSEEPAAGASERDDEQDEAVASEPESRSASEDDSADKPDQKAKAEPGDLEEEDPGPEPGQHGTSDTEDGAAPSKPAKAKSQGEHEADQDDRDSDSGEEAAQDDGLHDDFFRKGEEVDKEHRAAQAQAVKGAPRLEDTGQRQLVALRSTPEMQARRKRLRKIVGYVLAPAVIIALVAGFKAYNGKADAAAKSSSPVAKVTVQPPPSSASNRKPSVETPATAVSAADDGQDAGAAAMDADTLDAQMGDVLDAPAEVGADVGPDVGSLATPEAGDKPAEPDAGAAVAKDVDHRKEALAALNRGKWEEAERMAGAAVAADPEDATLYLYRGTALQEMGRRDDAKAVFKRCVEKAKRGPVNECRMFAR